MATVIKAVGARFNNPNLEGVVPFIYDGLVAAFRPNNTENGLLDLSGNGNTLQKIGSPTLSTKGASGDTNNGYKTNIQQKINMSMGVVAKKTVVAGDNGGRAVFVGNFETGSGVALYSNPSPVNKVYASANGASGSVGSASVDLTNGLDYFFAMSVIDGINNTITIYTASATTQLTSNTYTFTAPNTISDAPINPAYPIHLMAIEGRDDWLAKVDLSETLIYDRAITAAEVAKQYEFSKSAMAKIGISI